MPEIKPPQIGTFVAASYNGNWYIGRVIDVDEDDHDVNVSFMAAASAASVKPKYKWPKPDDTLWVSSSDIICEVPVPLATGRSERTFVLPDNTHEMIENIHMTK
ncbi:MAG: hypothetical protein ABW185_27905 [Sedimenticola sp.]